MTNINEAMSTFRISIPTTLMSFCFFLMKSWFLNIFEYCFLIQDANTVSIRNMLQNKVILINNLIYKYNNNYFTRLKRHLKKLCLRITRIEEVHHI